MIKTHNWQKRMTEPIIRVLRELTHVYDVPMCKYRLKWVVIKYVRSYDDRDPAHSR